LIKLDLGALNFSSDVSMDVFPLVVMSITGKVKVIEKFCGILFQIQDVVINLLPILSLFFIILNH